LNIVSLHLIMPGILTSTIGAVVPVTKQDVAGNAASLPTATECGIHLHFLETITLLKQQVEQWDKEAGWGIYLELAVSRFQTWISGYLVVKDEGLTSRIPPLDVLVVWHAFMLNPGPYTRFESGLTPKNVQGKGIDWQRLVSSDESVLNLRLIELLERMHR
jgi:hypothetical protein